MERVYTSPTSTPTHRPTTSFCLIGPRNRPIKARLNRGLGTETEQHHAKLLDRDFDGLV